MSYVIVNDKYMVVTGDQFTCLNKAYRVEKVDETLETVVLQEIYCGVDIGPSFTVHKEGLRWYFVQPAEVLEIENFHNLCGMTVSDEIHNPWTGKTMYKVGHTLTDKDISLLIKEDIDLVQCHNMWFKRI